MTGTQSPTGPTATEPVSPSSAPVHQQVYQRLRGMILFGELTPAQPVTIQGLVTELGAGMTPVREAIRRLIAEGALELQGNRRVCVPVLTSENIEELVFARGAIEPQLTARATKKATLDDLRSLARTDAELDAAIALGDVRDYMALNYRFHARIYAIANAPILTRIADGLWLRFGPSLRVVCGRVGTQNLPDRHKQILDAMHAQDSTAAAKAMSEDLAQGMDQLRAARGEAGESPDSN